MNKDFRYMNFKTSVFRSLVVGLPSFFFCLFSLFPLLSFSQVKSSIDSTKIKIGEQITYKIQVEVDTTDLVVFPEGQTFLPLEMIESYKTDTTFEASKLRLIKKYGLDDVKKYYQSQFITITKDLLIHLLMMLSYQNQTYY